MKKKIGFVVIFAALVLGSYAGMGIVTERTFKKNIDVLNQVNGIKVELVQYQRGWFKSHAILNWSMVIPARTIQVNGKSLSEPESNYKTQMLLTIYHGPIIVTNSKLLFGLGYAHSQILLPASYDAKFKEKYTPDSTKPTLDLDVFVSYLNKTRINLDAPQFKLIAKQGHVQFNWAGMVSQIDIASNRKHVDGLLILNGLTWVNDQLQGEIQQVASNYHLDSSNSGFYLGNAHVAIPSVIVAHASQKILEVNQFNMQTHNQMNQGLFDTSLEADLHQLLLNHKTYHDCLIKLAIRNLDAQVLAGINNKLSASQQGGIDGQRLLFSLVPELPQLVNKGAQFEISDLRMGMPQGDIRGHVLIRFPRENISNPFLLMQKITGDGSLTLATAILKDWLKDSVKNRILAIVRYQQAMAKSADQNQPSQNQAQMITPPQNLPNPANPLPLSAADIDKQADLEADKKINKLIQVGLLVPQQPNYSMEFKLADGQLLVNGKVFNPSMLQ